VRLVVAREARGVVLTVTTGFEGAELLGFTAYRLHGAHRTRVNDELVLARGGTGNAYRIVDEAGGTSLRSRSYEVEVVTRDGGIDQVLGPARLPGGPGARVGRR
jgi:hypothetical protein